MGVENLENSEGSKDRAKDQAYHVFNNICTSGKLTASDERSQKRELPIVREDGRHWVLYAITNSDANTTMGIPSSIIIGIEWLWKKWTDYMLVYNVATDSFDLRYLDEGQKQYKIIKNLWPDLLLEDVLPNFNERVYNARMQIGIKKFDEVKRANKLAYKEDQNDADRLLEENGLA